MNNSSPLIALGEVLTPVSRPESVDPEKIYKVLGAHWYAKGLYIKDVLPGSEIRADKAYRVEEGDFVYNRLFAWKGSFAVATKDAAGCYVSNEFPCFAVNRDRADPLYLWKYFSRSSAWDEALSLSTGGTPTSRNRLKEEKFLALRIPLPAGPEQRRIVARIESLAVKIKEARGLREQANGEAQFFVTNVHLHLAGDRRRKLGEIVKLDEDRVPIRPIEEYPQVGVKGFGAGLFPKPAIAGVDTTYSAFNRLYEGALVLSQVKGWEGAVAVCDGELAGWYVSPEYRTFRCIPSESRPDYLSAVVTTEWFWSRLKDATRGVGARRERTRPERFLEIEIPMPDVENQLHGETIFVQVDALKKLQAKTAAELDALLPSVLDKAFKREF